MLMRSHEDLKKVAAFTAKSIGKWSYVLHAKKSDRGFQREITQQRSWDLPSGELTFAMENHHF